MDRRIGIFRIDEDIIREYPDTAREILKGIIVLRCESLIHTDSLEYIGICDKFKECPKGHTPRGYKVIVDQELITDEEGSDTYIPVFKGFA